MQLFFLNKIANKIKGRITGTSKRSQRAMIITQDGRIVDVDMDVETGYYIDHDKRRAFLAVRENLLPMKDGTGYCAFFFEGDAAPINLGPRTKAIRDKFAASIKDIEREERANGMHAVSVQLSKDKMLETIKQILLIFAILTAAVVALSIVIYWFV